MTARGINRRIVLAGIATAPAAGIAGSAAASEGPMLADLLDAYYQARRREERTWQAYEDLSVSVKLPKVEVTFGRARIRNDDTGEISWGQWSASSEDQVKRFFESIDWAPDAIKAQRILERDQVLAQLREQERAYEQARKVSGLEDALQAHEEVVRQLVAAREAIFAYRPRTLDEMDRRDAFLAELNVFGEADFSSRELAMIFGSKV